METLPVFRLPIFPWKQRFSTSENLSPRFLRWCALRLNSVVVASLVQIHVKLSTAFAGENAARLQRPLEGYYLVVSWSRDRLEGDALFAFASHTPHAMQKNAKCTILLIERVSPNFLIASRDKLKSLKSRVYYFYDWVVVKRVQHAELS